MQKKETTLFPLRPFRTHGGAAVTHHKNTAASESVTMPAPKQVILPMQQHVGAPCTPLVKVGAYVYVGQKIADSDKPVSAPIHASVSGKVT
jgi:electron transport complex protein RnfC